MRNQDINLIDSLISKSIKEVFKVNELLGRDSFISEKEKRNFYNDQFRKRINLYRLLKNKTITDDEVSFNREDLSGTTLDII